MSFSDDAKAVIALTTRLGNGSRPSLSPTRWHELSAVLTTNDLLPGDLFSPSISISELPGLSHELAMSIQELIADASATTVAAGDLRRKGIWVLAIVDDGYPASIADRLGKSSPPVIFGVGEPGLLSGSGIGIVGSRNVRAEGAEVAQELAETAVRLGRPVVSGGARGVDQLAMNTAHRAGGSVIGVLADSLETRVQKSDILRALDAGSTCLLTQQAPSSGFSAGAAMSRNKLIYALCTVTVVVATDERTGGTWAGATEALKRSNGIVAVWRGEGEGPGNAPLERAGAVPIRSVDDLPRIIDHGEFEVDATADDPVQLGLLDSP